MGSGKVRLRYLDRAKGLGILMITLGHVMTVLNPVSKWMSLFKISIFYIVAGYMAAMRPGFREQKCSMYFKKLLSSLLWPYLTLSAISILGRAWFKLLQEKDILKMVIYDLKSTISFQGIGPLWFLPSFFIAQILFFLVIKSNSRLLQVVTFVVPLLLSPHVHSWYLALKEDYIRCSVLLLGMKSILAIWFILAGYWGQKLLRRLEHPAGRCVLGAVLFLSTFAMVPHMPKSNLNLLNLGSPPVLFFVGGAAGSFGALLIFEAMENTVSSDALAYWGRNSLVLMGTQRGLLSLNLATAAVEHVAMLHEELGVHYYLENLEIFLLVLMMEYAVIELLRTYLPFVTRFPGAKKRTS